MSWSGTAWSYHDQAWFHELRVDVLVGRGYFSTRRHAPALWQRRVQNIGGMRLARRSTIGEQAPTRLERQTCNAPFLQSPCFEDPIEDEIWNDGVCGHWPQRRPAVDRALHLAGAGEHGADWWRGILGVFVGMDARRSPGIVLAT